MTRGLDFLLVLVSVFFLVMASSSNPLERGKAAARTSLDVESYPDTPTGLSLEQVHIYVRHGKC